MRNIVCQTALLFLFCVLQVQAGTWKPSAVFRTSGSYPAGTKQVHIGYVLSYDYQNTRFNAIDFTGINNFQYSTKFRWTTGVHVEWVGAGGFGIGTGIKLSDVGWNRLNDDYSGEPFVKGMTYTFLYLSPSVGASKWFWFTDKLSGIFSLGSDFQFLVYDSEKYIFADGHTEKDQSPRIKTDRSNILFWASIRVNRQIGSRCHAGIHYLAGLNLHTYHQSIISNNAPLHSVGVTFNIKI